MVYLAEGVFKINNFWVTVKCFFDPEHWGQEQLLIQQIRTWVESQSIGVPFFGLRLGVSDITALGTFVLFILSYYYCMCARRENHEIGRLLVETKDDEPTVKLHVASSINSGMVIHPTSENDLPFDSLEQSWDKKTEKSVSFFRPTQWLLTFLPMITIIVALSSDLYFALGPSSPWKRNLGSNWDSLTSTYKYQLVLMDVFGLVMGIGTYIFCRNANIYNKSTKKIFNEYTPKTQPSNAPSSPPNSPISIN